MVTVNVSWKRYEEALGIGPEQSGIVTLRISGAGWLHSEELLEELLYRFREGLQLTSLKASASMFTKYYAKKLCTVLYGMSVRNVGLSLPLSQVTLELRQAPDFGIRPAGDSRLSECPATDREAWRRALLQDLFASNLHPLFETLAEKTHLHRDILWENALIYIRHEYSQWRAAAEDEDRRRIEEDYRYIALEAEPELFGLNGTHPWSKFNTELPRDTIPPRTTCCLRYQSAEGACCKTCPQATIPRG